MNIDQSSSSTDGMPVVAAPVTDACRVHVIDMLRGVALLGILLINIPFFSLPEYFRDFGGVWVESIC